MVTKLPSVTVCKLWPIKPALFPGHVIGVRVMMWGRPILQALSPFLTMKHISNKTAVTHKNDIFSCFLMSLLHRQSKRQCFGGFKADSHVECEAQEQHDREAG